MILAWLLVGTALATGSVQDGPKDIRVGHWLEARGDLGKDGRFEASRVEVLPPQRYEELIGIIPKSERERDEFELLGQRVTVSDKTDLEDVRVGRWGGKRVKVEGYWRGPGKLSSREVELRSGSGRERVSGRVDAIEKVAGGYLANVMIFRVFIPEDVDFRCEEAVVDIPLTEQRGGGMSIGELESRGDDLDDLFGGGIPLLDDVTVFGQFTTGFRVEDNYDLDDSDLEDEEQSSQRARVRMHYFPWRNFVFVTEGTVEFAYESDEDGHDGTVTGASVGETFGYWTRAFGIDGLDVQIGRQDFDEEREWLYDANLDALRFFWSQPNYAIEASVSTLLGGDGDARDQNTLNTFLYVSNNDEKRHLAAYALFRDTDQVGADPDVGGFVPDEEAVYLGARVLGKWFPDHKSWIEFAYLFGDRDTVVDNGGPPEIVGHNVSAFAYDIGTTWSPEFADPFYFTLGYALGSGDSNTAGKDGSFRQSGLQDNNARFGGVSSFRYYGELSRPDLTNIGILTAGVGARLTEDVSLDVVFHDYTQDAARGDIREFSDLSPDMDILNTTSADLGWEVDVILGMRQFKNWDIKLIGAYYNSGDAFTTGDDAMFARLQIRYRF